MAKENVVKAQPARGPADEKGGVGAEELFLGAIEHAAGARAPRILSLCCLYPNPVSPGQGLFVERRLRELAELTPLTVVAPQAIVKYGNPSGKRVQIGRRLCAVQRRNGPLLVLHPRWFYPPFSGTFSAFWLFLQLLPVLMQLRRNFNFDIIDAHFGHPEGVAAALLSSFLRVPFFVTLRGNEPKHSRSFFGRWCMAWAFRKAARVFTVSERLRTFAVQMGADPRKVRTIPNGIDATVFYSRDQAACRRQYGFELGRPLIVSAGALVERKGHHRIIEALTALSKGAMAPQLAIAGGHGPEGAYEEQLKDLVETLEIQTSVRFLGQVTPETLAELMSAADVLCLASTNEGWPNVVHEALACGTPVVATDVGAVPDMLDGGRYGIIVPVDDQGALQRGLQEALGRKWNRQAIAAWGQARSWRRVASEVFAEMQLFVEENS